MTTKADDDPTTAIKTIDSVVRFTGGGAYYGLVIPRPLPGDQISQHRLLVKLEACIHEFYSPESLARSGAPTLDNSRIHVRIHPHSDPAIFELLDRCRVWIEKHLIEFDVDTEIRQDFPTIH